MQLASIAVLGGGPGGLYAARLLKLGYPDAQVDLYEQGVPDKTFGFGVGLATRTQRNLHDADSASFRAIAGAAYPHDMSMQVDGRVAQLPHGNLLAIARTTLLGVLQASAEQACVRLHFGARSDVRAIDADLIVAADGAGSGTREMFADEFQREIETGAGLYLWCGTEFALPSALFTPVPSQLIRAIQDGIDAGVFRPVDPRLAALGIIGMINWIAWWYRPDHYGTGESVAGILADMAVDSVLHERHAPLSGDGATAAIAALRLNLDYLEQHVKGSR